MILTLDYETRSCADIKKCGTYVYAHHPTTEILMLAVKVDDSPAVMYIPPAFEYYKMSEIAIKDLNDLIAESKEIVAHNAFFERHITKAKGVKLGMLDLPLEYVRDTMAQSSMCGLPRNLDMVSRIVSKGKENKDKEGSKYLMKIIKPKDLNKAEYEALLANESIRKPKKICSLEALKKYRREYIEHLAGGGFPINDDFHRSLIKYYEDKETFLRVVEYARQDVNAEYYAYTKLPKLPESELKVWQLDQTINDRGVLIDRKNAIGIKIFLDNYSAELAEKAISLTDNKVTSIKSPSSVKSWLSDNGLDLGDISKQTVADVLEWDRNGKMKIEIYEDDSQPIIEYVPFSLQPQVREFLQYRQQGGKSSVGKYDTMIAQSNIDGRCHGMFVYHGAATGRWAGAGVQPQNLPRPAGASNLVDKDLFSTKDIYADENDASLLATGDLEAVNMFWKDPIVLSADLIRTMFRAPFGWEFVCADFSAIEARGLAYLAGQEDTLDVFRKGLDVYKFEAMKLYKTTYEAVDSKQRQVGKTCVLALGYGGGWAAMLRFGADRLGLTEEDGVEIVKKWRENNKKITTLWKQLCDTAIIAMECKNTEIKVPCNNNVSFIHSGSFLKMKIPSGRYLYYYAPKVQEVEMAWSTAEKPAYKKMVVAKVVNEKKQFVDKPLNHLILSENLTQAFCADLLRNSLLNIEKHGKYKTVMHIHDEILAECPKGQGDIAEFENLMTMTPEWAKGMPIKAEGWIGQRYRK